jgi:hypothetical protein
MLLQVLQKHLNEQMPWPKDVNPQLSEGICQIIAKMVAKSADDRYQEPSEISADLDILEEGGELKIDDTAFANSSVKVPTTIRQRASGRKLSERGSGRFAALKASCDEKKNSIAVIAGIAGIAVIVLVIGVAMFGGETKPPRKPPKAKEEVVSGEPKVVTRRNVAERGPDAIPPEDDDSPRTPRVPTSPDEVQPEVATHKSVEPVKVPTKEPLKEPAMVNETVREPVVVRPPDIPTRAIPVSTGPKLAPLLAAFDTAMASSDYVTARRSAAMAAANRANASHAEVLSAASRVAAALLELPEAYARGAEALIGSNVRLRLKKGRVKATIKGVTDEGIAVTTTYTINGQKRERKRMLKWAGLHARELDELAKLGGVKPDPSNRAIATAYKKLALKDFGGASSALGSAGLHPLVAHLKSRIAELDPEQRLALENQKTRALAESWTPAQIKTALWLDAADASTITQVDGAVSRWKDKSGNGNHATQGNGSRQPSYRASDAMLGGMPSLYLPDDRHRFLETPSLTAQRLYMVCYYKDGLATTFESYHTILGDIDNLRTMRGISKDNSWGTDEKSFFAGGGIYRNGSTTSSGGRALPMPATLWKADTGGVALTRAWRVLGGVKNWQLWDGGLGELILTDGSEDLATQQRIEGYLARKWGLGSSLPARHPYKASGVTKPRTRSVRNSTGYTKAVLADKPVVYYRLGESYAARAVRNFGSGGAAWDGMLTGRGGFGARGASKALGTALDLSGRNDGYITTGRNISDILNQTASMEFWIKTTQITDGTWRAAAIAGQDNSKGADIWWGINYYGKIGIMAGKPETGAFAGPINDGEWHYVLMTFDKPAGVISVYLDGNPTATATFNLGGDDELTKPYVMTYNRVGHGDSQHGKKLDAVIDEVAIYNRVLTGADGRAHYEAAGVATSRRRPTPPAAVPRKKTGASGDEQDARKAWRDIQAKAKEKNLSAAKKWALLMSIKAFEDRYGGTEFAASIIGELARIKVHALE